MKLKAVLSVSSVQKLIDDVKAYKRDLQDKVSSLLEDLAEQGINECTTQIMSLDAVWKGDMLRSVASYVDRTTSKAVIRVNVDYAVFVEFGTGVKGELFKGYPEPQIMSKANYRYMGGTHYVTLKDGRTGWFYTNKDGKLCFTQGQASRPFMYNTAEYLKDYIRRL